MSESQALSLFLRGIKDPDFDMKVEIKKNKDDNTLMQYMIAFQKKERVVMYKGSTERKFRNKIRHVCEEDDCYLDKCRPFKISHRQG